MPEYTEEQKAARQKAVRNYEKNNYRLNIVFPKGTKERIEKLGLDKTNSAFIRDTVLAKLDELEQQLPGRLFFRCHQSYIISLYFVEKMDTGKFIVQSAEIPVSRKYQRAAREMYYDYMFEKM